MAADHSAFAALGLQPGADPASIDNAYRRLIKLHHPDRAGGDAVRAADINRAYFELRRRGNRPSEPLEPGDYPFTVSAPRGRRRRIWPLLVAAGLAVAGWAAIPALRRAIDGWARAVIALAPGEQVDDMRAARANLHAPLALAAIRAAVADARRLSAGKNLGALIDHSRACYTKLHSAPTLARLDGCAAFDDAVVMIQNSDPIEDEGPFSAWSVTARQTRAAALLSDDYMAADSRMENIRVTVELALAGPPEAAPEVALPQNDGNGV